MMALLAGPPSPPLPPPANVEIVGVVPADTMRIRFVPNSANQKLPEPSAKLATGTFRTALVAGPPSPQVLNVVQKEPLPATVVIMWFVVVSTLRTRWLFESSIKTLPLGSTDTPRGAFSPAAFAGPLSPEKVKIWLGLPA